MANNWQKIKLSDVAAVELCSVDKKTKPNERVVRQCNYTDIYRNWQIDESRSGNFLNVTCTDEEYKKFRLKQGQVAITKDSETKDDIGKSAYIAESFIDTVLGYHLALITPDKNKIDGYFLNCLLHTKSLQKYFENNAGGSGQRASLAITALRDTPLIIPDLYRQRAIARVLSQLDEKIELNRKINAELENMAKTIYDYWFLQFDFPDENGKPYRSSGGEMVYNPTLKRDIPKGWNVKTLEHYCKIESGFPFKSEYYLKKGIYKIITIKNVQDGELETTKVNFVNKLPSKLSDHDKLKTGDILISLTGNIGRLCIVDEENLLLNQRVGVIISKFTNINPYIYQLLSSQEITNKLDSISGGTSQKNLSPLIAGRLKVISPIESIIRRFCEKSHSIMDAIIINKQQNKNLAELRDFLLPMLMNGQVTVEKKA